MSKRGRLFENFDVRGKTKTSTVEIRYVKPGHESDSGHFYAVVSGKEVSNTDIAALRKLVEEAVRKSEEFEWAFYLAVEIPEAPFRTGYSRPDPDRPWEPFVSTRHEGLDVRYRLRLLGRPKGSLGDPVVSYECHFGRDGEPHVGGPMINMGLQDGDCCPGGPRSFDDIEYRNVQTTRLASHLVLIPYSRETLAVLEQIAFAVHHARGRLTELLLGDNVEVRLLQMHSNGELLLSAPTEEVKG